MELHVFPKSRGEQSTVYIPGAVPDMAAFEQLLINTRQAIRKLDSQQSRIDEKMAAARSRLLNKSEAQRAYDFLTAEIAKVEALAFVNDSGGDIVGLKAKLAKAENQLKLASSEAMSADEAIGILEEKAAKNADFLKTLRTSLSEAERKWLKARQDHLFEEFRRRFHDLYDTVASLLALEIHPSFDGSNSWTMVRPGSDLLGRLASALPYNGPRNYTPTWVHLNNRFEFPGFSAAQKELAEELSQTRPSSETEK